MSENTQDNGRVSSTPRRRGAHFANPGQNSSTQPTQTAHSTAFAAPLTSARSASPVAPANPVGAAAPASPLDAAAPASPLDAAAPARGLVNLPEVTLDYNEQDAPRPVLDPSATGSFSRISQAQGAQVQTRSNIEQMKAAQTSVFSRQEFTQRARLSQAARPVVQDRRSATKKNGKVFAVVIVCACVVVAAAIFAVNGFLNRQQANAPQGSVEQAQASVDAGITYHDVTYRIEQNNGVYSLVSYAAGAAEGTTIYTLEGTPVELVLYNGAIVVPQNKPDGTWDILSYMIGAGAIPSQVVGSDGTPIVGQGTISKVQLQDSNLLVTDTQNNTTTVSLV